MNPIKRILLRLLIQHLRKRLDHLDKAYKRTDLRYWNAMRIYNKRDRQ